VYSARNHAIYALVSLYTGGTRADTKALLDSGATENFIHPETVAKYHLTMVPLRRPRKVKNVDGTLNKAGAIEYVVPLRIKFGQTSRVHNFLVADLGPDRIILGYPFFEDADPTIDWQAGTLPGVVRLAAPDCVLLRKTTMASELAQAAQDKRTRTWQEMVPARYHHFKKVFSEEASNRFPERKRWDHAIDLKPDTPSSINSHVYPLPPREKEEQHKFIVENRKLKCIRESKSPYAAGFFLIKKKDGKYRPVQDYRNLNKWTFPNKYPLPLISNLIHSLSGRRLFTKFDVRWGYNNIRIKEGDEWKAAFKTSEGLFEPTVMFFGLTNSPATFQSMMDDIFAEEVAQGWLKIYMDDMVITTEDDEEFHAQCVERILRKLLENDLFLKPEKCQFHQRKIEYLGVVIGNGSVEMDPVKVRGIGEWPTPTTVKEVRSFLGFCNFYRAFIPNFSTITRPLNNLTRKGQQWQWGPKEQTAVDTLKLACTSYPVLCTR
jgi:hypothetical protein